jgi:hypothetical protein
MQSYFSNGLLIAALTLFIYGGYLKSALICGLGFFCFGLIAPAIFYEEFLAYKRQHCANHERAKLTDSPYFLLLRSFHLTKLYQRSYIYVDYLPDEGPVEDEAEADWFLNTISNALKPFGPIVIIGASSDPLTYEHNILMVQPNLGTSWLDVVDVLAKDSRAILIIPEVSSGILTELRYLKTNDMLRRAVFIMLPMMDISHRQRYKTIDNSRPERWDNVKEKLLSEGIHLPSYSEAGTMFTLDQCGRIAQSVLLSGNDDIAYKAAFGEILKNNGEESTALNRVYQNISGLISNPSGVSFWGSLIGRSTLPGYQASLIWIGGLLIGWMGFVMLLWKWWFG